MFTSAKISDSCGYCKGTLHKGTAPFCRQCGQATHKTCWEDFDGCSTAFCPGSPGFEIGLNSSDNLEQYLESFPGVAKFCPECATQREGIYCEDCGLDFLVFQANEKIMSGGRAASDLLGVDFSSAKAPDLVRSSSFKKKRDCPNCGTAFEENLSECAVCLYEKAEDD